VEDKPQEEKTKETLDSTLRCLLRVVADSARRDRTQIAKVMSDISHLRVTRYMLDDWLADTKTGARFPALLVGAFCQATGDDRLKQFVCGLDFQERLQLQEHVIELKEALADFLKRERQRAVETKFHKEGIAK
jgi:hypothetical protein